MKFRLIAKSSDKYLSKFHVVNDTGSTVGSVNVPADQVDDLLANWNGPKPTTAEPVSGSKCGGMAKYLAEARFADTSQAAIVRGC
jgi:hypothetical protein